MSRTLTIVLVLGLGYLLGAKFPALAMKIGLV